MLQVNFRRRPLVAQSPARDQHQHVFSLALSSLTFATDHFDHLLKEGGPTIIGFGGDYDGVTRWVQLARRRLVR